MMWTTAGCTFFASAAAAVLPLLLALGFFLGGDVVEAPAPSTTTGDDTFGGKDTGFDSDDGFAEDSDVIDSGDSDIELHDEDDFSDVNSGIYKVDGDDTDPDFGFDDMDDEDDGVGTSFEFDE